jgi:hypothetical protein
MVMRLVYFIFMVVLCRCSPPRTAGPGCSPTWPTAWTSASCVSVCEGIRDRRYWWCETVMGNEQCAKGVCVCIWEGVKRTHPAAVQVRLWGLRECALER